MTAVGLLKAYETKKEINTIMKKKALSKIMALALGIALVATVFTLPVHAFDNGKEFLWEKEEGLTEPEVLYSYIWDTTEGKYIAKYDFFIPNDVWHQTTDAEELLRYGFVVTGSGAWTGYPSHPIFEYVGKTDEKEDTVIYEEVTYTPIEEVEEIICEEVTYTPIEEVEEIICEEVTYTPIEEVEEVIYEEVTYTPVEEIEEVIYTPIVEDTTEVIEPIDIEVEEIIEETQAAYTKTARKTSDDSKEITWELEIHEAHNADAKEVIWEV